MQRRLKLVHQLSAFADEFNFIPAQQTQFVDQRIQRLECPPAMAIDPQRIPQAPCIQKVGLGAAGGFPIAIAFGTLRIDWINDHPALQQLFNSCALIGFDGGRQVRIGSDHFLPFGPTFGAVIES